MRTLRGRSGEVRRKELMRPKRPRLAGSAWLAEARITAHDTHQLCPATTRAHGNGNIVRRQQLQADTVAASGPFRNRSLPPEGRMDLTTARLFVSNLEDARDFYTGHLGLELIADGSRLGYCVFAAGPVSLVVERVDPGDPDEDQVLVGRFSGLSFAVDDIAKTHRELIDKGVVFTEEPERQPWGGIVATFRDPSGNRLQLAQHP